MEALGTQLELASRLKAASRHDRSFHNAHYANVRGDGPCPTDKV
jgi:hypothetical protein